MTLLTILGGAFPGPLGWAAALCVKFSGYLLAGLLLKKLYPSISAIPATIALTRMGLGLAIEPATFVATMPLLDYLLPRFTGSDLYVFVLIGVPLRILVWALVIWIFLRKTGESGKYLWINSAAGMVWSFMLDVPAFFLANVAPGKITIC